MDEIKRNETEENGEQDENISALEEGDLIEMIDENGETISFVFVDALEYNDEIYLALAEPEQDDEVFFLKIEQDDDGNDVYTAPEEEIEDALFAKFSEEHNTIEEE